MSDITLFEEYGAEIGLSLVILTAILDLFLIYRIHYGEQVITKITLRPYYVALGYLFALLSYAIVSCLKFEKFLKFGRTRLEDDDFDFYFSLTNFFSKLLLLCFFAVRIFEDRLIHLFMDFQRVFRLEELDLAREEFIRFEDKYKYRLNIILRTLVGFMTATYLL